MTPWKNYSLTILMVTITLWSLDRQILAYFLSVWRIIVMDPVTVTATDFGGFSRFFKCLVAYCAKRKVIKAEKEQRMVRWLEERVNRDHSRHTEI